ncbi:NACHT domain-containing protein [Kibdelosporangium philippinense]|uniref:NACHT domain-containing protein n=1 Tax=Kibdelosporangium philippinense TaxID=211113 RepID=A0ABS8ZJP5_9PSEU|nr:NACHT domain-containing protein [Kibdelosporangium philippinense]MCE7006042.1 NACHT domain-containing protein [Kibdelosporangium philippinense]
MNRRAVIITALEVEFTAVAEQLTGSSWQAHPQGTRYLVGEYGDWTVALVEIGRGNEEAGHSTERALEFFKPSVALFVGVAGGIKDVRLGDVVFATEVVGYEYGKETSDAFLPRGQVGSSSHELIQAARQLRHELRPRSDYGVIIEPIAAGGKVVADASAPSAALIQRHYSQVVATEQEGLGFLKAAAARQTVAVGVVRGISDLLSGKSASDAAGWQIKAAHNASQFTLRLLDILAPPEPVTLETVAQHMMAAWLRLRGWTNPDYTSGITDKLARRRAQRLLDELQDILVDRLEQRWPNARPSAATVQALAQLTREPPAIVDIGTIRGILTQRDQDEFVSDVAGFLVEAYLALPELLPDKLAGLTGRATELRERLERGLSTMPQRHMYFDEHISDATYRTDYLRAISHRLDTLQILGIDLARSIERYSLTTAYVSLSAGHHTDVADVLASSKRLLLIGEAGSGKTTLLQWVAVTTAREQQPDWGPAAVPFLIRLRRYINGPMPDVEDFPTEVAATLASRKPPNWCSTVLRDGNGIVLIDGLDELPAARRATVQEWLDDLFSAYPDNIFILSGRPAALRDNSFRLTGFDLAELLPMGPAQITAFIKHWHVSTGGNLPTDTDRADHQIKGDLLAEHILATPPLRDLARTPLLCAVLCALAYARKGVSSLPRRRVELYQAALEMLTGRRDSERQIATSTLGSTERIALLEDLAQWLIRNGQSEISREKALRHVDRALRSLRNVTITAEEALQDLIERSILREPATDLVDFVHRTFEEYLAARWMNDQGDFGALLEKAGDPAFSEVITLVAGLSRPRDANELIGELIDKAETTDPDLYQLATRCVDACLRVEPKVIKRLNRYFARLIPPKNYQAAMTLATGGDTSAALIEEYLNNPAVSIETAAKLDGWVVALRQIGSPESLRVLAQLHIDLRTEVAPALVQAWSYFPPLEYARRVLIPLSRAVHVSMSDLNRIPFTRHLPDDYLVRADLSEFSPAELASRLAQSRLHAISTAETGIDGFNLLLGIDGITSIATVLQVDEEPIQFSECTTLETLRLTLAPAWRQGELDCHSFLRFPNLTELQVHLYQPSASAYQLTNLHEINNLPHLRHLEIDGSFNLMTYLRLPALRTLWLRDWGTEDLTPIIGCTALQELNITGSVVATLDDLQGMTELRRITVRNCMYLMGIGVLTELPHLESVDLRGCLVLDDNAQNVIDSLPSRVEVLLDGSRLDPDLRDAYPPEFTSDYDHDFDEDNDEHVLRSVPDIAPIDQETAGGWIIRTIAEIEQSEDVDPLPGDEVGLEGFGEGFPPGPEGR